MKPWSFDYETKGFGAAFVSKCQAFSNPKLELEQYATDAHIAARMLYTASTSFGDIEDKTVLDLGCGCGALSLAAVVLGAARVVGFDIDDNALAQLRDNAASLEVEDEVELINADVSTIPEILKERFDTVLLNPPFGTKDNAGVDMMFLKQALSMLEPAGGTVYSMHKSSTRDFILKKARESWQVAKVEVLAEIKFEIKRQFKFHTKEKLFVNVDLLRLKK